MRWVKRWPLSAWVAAAAVVTGLLVASAGGANPDVAYGVGSAKGCASPSFVGGPYNCFYVFQNATPFAPPQIPSTDTVMVTSAVDTVYAAAGAVSSGTSSRNSTSFSSLRRGARARPSAPVRE